MHKFIRTLSIAGALALVAGAASAQSAAANQQRCQQLGQEIQASFNNAVQARVPKTDPSTFNQEGYDIKGIMSQDVTAGLGKLLSLDFSGIIDSIVKKGMDKAMSKATNTFNTKINGVLQGVGATGVSYGNGGFNVNTGAIVDQAAGKIGNGVAGGQSATVTGPYGRK